MNYNHNLIFNTYSMIRSQKNIFKVEYLMKHTSKIMNQTKQMRKVEFGDLQPNRKYIIVNIYRTIHFVGIFDDYEKIDRWGNVKRGRAVFKELIEINPLELDDNMYYLLGDVKKNESVWTNTLEYEKLKHAGVFYNNDSFIFYDLEEIIEKGKKARQSMEQRSLDIILKRLVNEDFQW